MIHSIPRRPSGKYGESPDRNRPNRNSTQNTAWIKPKTEQYVIFMKNLLHGDLGESLRYPGRSIADTVVQNSKVSGTVGGVALVFGIAVGITLGVVAAMNKNKWPDYIVMFIAILGVTIPVFVLSALLQYFFTVQHVWLPTTGWGKPKHIILPALVLSFNTIATYARYMKSNMLEVMNQDYILTAQAKGVDSFHVITRHVAA